MTEPDVSATLDALERKLRDLERDLAGVAPAAPPAAAPAPSRGEGLDALAGEVDDLGRYRERLARTQRELEDEYGRMLGRLESLAGTERRAPAPPPAEAVSGAEPAPAAPATAAILWAIDAGPFADLAALGAFEAELAALGEVEVTDFEGRRATLELRAAGELDLVAALGAVADVHVEAPGRARAEL